MEIDDLLKLIKLRSNVVKFKSDPVSDEDLEKILEAARWAPSSGNTQPWELIIIKNQETKENIAKIHARAMSGSEKIKKLPDRYLDPPILIAVCIDTRIKEKYPDLFSREFLIDGSTGCLFQNMWLTATSLGLGMGMGSQPLSAQEELRELLEVPEYLWIPEIIQIGYPATDRIETDRRDLQEFTHREKLEESKLRKED